MTERKETQLFWILYFLLAGLFALRLVPFISPTSRTWGFNQLLFLPDYALIIYIMIAVFALFWPFSRTLASRGELLANRIAQFLFESPHRTLNRLIIVSLAAALIIIFRAPTHFLGDGYSLLSNLASPAGTFIKWTEKGIALIQINIQSALGPVNEQTALWTFRIISFISGLISFWFFFLIADILGENRIKKFLILSILILSGSTLLFFGYVENYPPLWPALTGFIYFSIRHIKIGRGILTAIIFLLAGILIHLEMTVFIPAMIFLIFVRGRGYAIYRTWRPFWWLFFTIALASMIYLLLSKIRTDLFFENIFLPLFGGKPIAPSYSVFSLSHITDMANLLTLLSPILPLLLILFFYRTKMTENKNLRGFLFICSLGAVLFLLGVDPTLGMARDWDLFSLSALSLNLFLSGSIILDKAINRRLLIPIVAYAATATISFLSVNLNEFSSTQYCQYIINLDKEKSFGALIALHRYYKQKGDIYRTDSVGNVYNSAFANEIMIERAQEALEKGDFRSARELSEKIMPDIFSSRYHALMSNIYFQESDSKRALEEIDKSLQLQPYNSEFYLARAMIYSRLRRNNDALHDLLRGYRYDMKDKEILEGLAAVYLYVLKPDSAAFYAARLVEIDSFASNGYYYLSKSYAVMGNVPMARRYLEDFKRYSNIAAMEQTRGEELERLIKELQFNGK